MRHCNSHLPLTGVLHQRPSIMYRHDSNKAPVTYQDVSAYFSEEEWKLLHDWQKELYSKVMNEVHQCLTSLGPLIASTVYSLTTKERKDAYSEDHPDSDTRRSIDGDVVASSVVSFWINPDGTQSLKENSYTDLRDHSHRTFNADMDLRTDREFRSNGLMEHHAMEAGESGGSFSSGQVDLAPVVPFQIKEEVETSFMGNQDSDRTEIRNSLKDDGTLTMQQSCGESVKCHEWTLPGKASSGKNGVLPISEKQIQSVSEMWSVDYQGLGEVATTQHEISFGNPSDYNWVQETHELNSTGKFNASTIKIVNTKHPMCLQQKGTSDMFLPFQKSFSQNTGFLRVAEDRPFKCMECGKSFRQKAHLIRHQTTHSGYKPFQCTECQKCFSRNDNLIIHRRKHTGERPYKCAVCLKGFRLKKSLISHQAKHRGTLTQRDVLYMCDTLPS